MRWLKHPAALVVGSIILILLGIFVAEYILFNQVFDQLLQHCAGDNETPANAENDGVHGQGVSDRWWQPVPDVAQAIFAFFLTVATYIQIRLWKRANMTAESALDEARQANDNACRAAAAAEEANISARYSARQTKRSVDAFVDSERGSLELFTVFPRTEGDDRIHYSVKNIGRGKLVVKQIWNWHTLVPKGREAFRVPFPQHKIEKTHRALEAGAEINTHPTEGHGYRVKNGAISLPPEAWPLLNDGSHWVCIQFFFRYTTILGRMYQRRITVYKSFVPYEAYVLSDNASMTNEKLVLQGVAFGRNQ